MDFALILVVATFITGLIWLFDHLVLKKGRDAILARGDLRELLLSSMTALMNAITPRSD